MRHGPAMKVCGCSDKFVPWIWSSGVVVDVSLSASFPMPSCMAWWRMPLCLCHAASRFETVERSRKGDKNTQKIHCSRKNGYLCRSNKTTLMKPTRPKLYLYTALACLLLIIGLLYYFFATGLSNEKTVQYVCIDADDTQDSVFAKLAPITTRHAMSGFKTLARHADYAARIREGRYAIHPGESAFTVFRRFMRGVQEPINLTIPEVRTMERMAALLSRKLMLDSATIASALTDSAFCVKYGYDTATIAALFIPNTYNIYWNVSMEQLMERMGREHDAFWNEERRAKAEAMGLSVAEVATLASIIDEETANNAEKPMIAGMYYNRLKIGMPLQADPTIKFALKDFGLHRIYRKLLHTDSPYNTYMNVGLPPGPIKVASIAGIDAVLNHAEHDYLYMCAKEDFSGTHNFAATYEEHLKNAERYARALDERGIK